MSATKPSVLYLYTLTSSEVVYSICHIRLNTVWPRCSLHEYDAKRFLKFVEMMNFAVLPAFWQRLQPSPVKHCFPQALQSASSCSLYRSYTQESFYPYPKRSKSCWGECHCNPIQQQINKVWNISHKDLCSWQTPWSDLRIHLLPFISNRLLTRLN